MTYTGRQVAHGKPRKKSPWLPRTTPAMIRIARKRQIETAFVDICRERMAEKKFEVVLKAAKKKVADRNIDQGQLTFKSLSKRILGMLDLLPKKS